MSIVLNMSALMDQPLSIGTIKRQLHASSYQVCAICHTVKFLTLSRDSQSATSRALFPAPAPFLGAEFDPLQSSRLPFQLPPEDARELNEVKAYCEFCPPQLSMPPSTSIAPHPQISELALLDPQNVIVECYQCLITHGTLEIGQSLN